MAVFVLPGWDRALEYDRQALAAGQLWRLVTCHWTHFTANHLLWDVIGFLPLALLCEARDRRHFLLTLLLAALAIPLVLLAAMPQMNIYRGLSGLDSALFGLLIALQAREALACRDRRAVALCLFLVLLFAVKIAYECLTGGAIFISDNGGTIVPVPAAHIIGALAGAGVGLPPSPSHRRPHQAATP